MNTELRKKLEEATEKYVLSLSLPSVERTYCAAKEDFLAGAEHGYKEAIAVAKEWLKEHFFYKHHLAEYYWESKCDDMDEALADLEADINKLWEEKPAVSSATINIRPTNEKMETFKDTIKKKYHLSATDADLITGRVEMLLAEQRKEIVEQACEWLKSHKHIHSPERLGSVYFTNILTKSADMFDELRKAMNNQNK